MSIVALATLVEILHFKKPECTLSAATRALCRTDTRLGRAAFVTGWWSLAVWFTLHVLRGDNGLPSRTS